MGSPRRAHQATRLRRRTTARGTGPAAAGGQRVIGARALTAAAAAVGLLGGPTVWTTYAEPTPTPSGTPAAGPSGLPVTVELGGVSPLAPQPGDTLVVRGTVRNVSSSPITQLTVHLALSPSKIAPRGEFDSYAATPDGPPPADGVVPASETSTLAHTDLA